MRRVFGGTVNDVVLAAVAGALRRLLAERGERLEDPLVAMVPMSRRAEADRGVLGNKVSAMLVSLATQIADPVERYTTIAAGTRLAKDQARVLSEELIQGWAQLALPALSSRVARLAGNLRLFDHVPPLFNVLVSNVAGPEFGLWCAGRVWWRCTRGAAHRRCRPQRHRGELRRQSLFRDPRVQGTGARSRPSRRPAGRRLHRARQSGRTQWGPLGLTAGQDVPPDDGDDSAVTRPGVARLAPSQADVAQLVEHHLAKVRVAGSNPVVRSKTPGQGVGASQGLKSCPSSAHRLPITVDDPHAVQVRVM